MTGRGDGHFLAGVLDSPRPFALRVARTSALLASTTTLAADSRARRRGLIGRDRLGPGEALVIAPSQGIHTFGMQFAIDVVFVDRHGRIAPRIPLRRAGEPAELVGAALLLAAPASSYMTGSTITVDGGFLAGGSSDRDDAPNEYG